MQKVNYADLNPRQQECYNFQKISAVLAEYGFDCIKLSDDWQGPHPRNKNWNYLQALADS